MLTLRATKKTRLAAKTVLHVFTGGKVDETGSGSEQAIRGLPPFTFSKPRDAVMDDKKTPTTIGEFIKATGADRLFGGSPFTRGVPPPTFVTKKVMHYWPKAAEERDALVAVASANVNILWVVMEKQGKVVPKGLAVTTKASISLPANEDVPL